MRTWGQLRNEVSKFAPGEDLQLITQWLNAAYREILDHFRWKLLEKNAVLETTAEYTTGTVSVTQGSAAIVGVGTAWTSAMTGLGWRICGQAARYTFTYVSATTGTLDRPFEGASGTALGYSIFQNLYPLPSDVKYVQEIVNPCLGRPLVVKTRAELDEVSPGRTVYGEPQLWAPGPDSDEEDPPVLHSIELYPIPQLAQGLPYSYQQAVIEFDGTNTSGGPLPWISTDALVAGAKARALAHQKDYAAAGEETARALQFRMQMTNVEARRTGPVRISMARRFIRHRQKRWTR